MIFAPPQARSQAGCYSRPQFLQRFALETDNSPRVRLSDRESPSCQEPRLRRRSRPLGCIGDHQQCSVHHPSKMVPAASWSASLGCSAIAPCDELSRARSVSAMPEEMLYNAYKALFCDTISLYGFNSGISSPTALAWLERCCVRSSGSAAAIGRRQWTVTGPLPTVAKSSISVSSK
jgi:hypothetical protein